MVLVGVPFTVQIARYKINYRAICISDLNGKSFEKNLIKILPNGRMFTVEDNWFDYKLTGRKITYEYQSKLLL